MKEKMLTKKFGFEAKQFDDGAGTFEGWLSVFGNLDEGGDIVEPGAFTKTLKDNGGEDFPLLWQHDHRLPIGKFTAEEREGGLWIKGALLKGEVRQASEAYALMKARVVKGLSIGFGVVKKKMDEGVRRLLELKLYEGSIVTFPMNLSATVQSVKADGEKDFDDSLRRRQLMSAPDMMICALWESLDSLLYFGDMTAEESMAAAGESIDQFRMAYMEMLPGLMEMVQSDPGMGMKAARLAFERAMKAAMTAAKKMGFEAVGTDDAAGDTEDSAVSTEKTAADTSEDQAVAAMILRVAEKLKPEADKAA